MSDTETCKWCGFIHAFVCPTVKAIEYFPDGTIKRVEFKGAADFVSPSALSPYVQPPNYAPRPSPPWPDTTWVWAGTLSGTQQ